MSKNKSKYRSLYRLACLAALAVLTLPGPPCAQAPQLQKAAVTEGPVFKQLYARNAANRCTLVVKGTASSAVDQVRLNVYAGKDRSETLVQAAQGSFAFAAGMAAGLVEYRFELMARQGGVESQAWSVDSVVCGDAYVIYGQSNAEALYGTGAYPFQSQWIRTYRGRWNYATAGGGDHIGVWGQHLGKLLTEKQKVPVCLFNPALGNTSLDELSPGFVAPAGSAVANEAGKYGSLYGRMVGWVKEARLQQDVRALLWHQGEKQVYGNDYAGYYQDFLALKKAVYADMPGIRDVFLFQIKTGCGSGGIGWSRIFEDQRKLAADFEDIGVMTTLAPNLIGCHLGEDDLPGYQQAAESLYPLIDKRFYGGKYAQPITPPDIVQVAYTGPGKDELVLQFDQDVQWTDSLSYDPANPVHAGCGKPRPNYSRDLFGLDGLTTGQVASGRSQGSRIYLKLKARSTAKQLAYPHGNLNGCWAGPFLTGARNGLGALGFLVPIADSLTQTPVAVQSGRAAHWALHRDACAGSKACVEPGFDLAGRRRSTNLAAPDHPVAARLYNRERRAP